LRVAKRFPTALETSIAILRAVTYCAPDYLRSRSYGALLRVSKRRFRSRRQGGKPAGARTACENEILKKSLVFLGFFYIDAHGAQSKACLAHVSLPRRAQSIRGKRRRRVRATLATIPGTCAAT
jgi:hypothetical protein